MLNKVILPYTIWYTGLEKILRLNLDKGIDTVTNISTKATLNGTSVNDLVSAIFNPKTKSIDITIRSDARMDVDGEMEISLSYSDAKTHESILVVSVRSHENTATETPEEVKQTKLTLLNGQSHTVGAADEQVVYSFDLVDRNVTDEFATYGDVKDMLIGLGVTDSGEKDQYTILLEGDNLVLSKENDPSYRKVINLAKYHDEVSGEPLNVEDLKRDILSIVDGKLPDFEILMNDILAEAVKKDDQLKVDILHEVDGKIPNRDTIKQEILADVNPRIPDKETLKTEILESAGEKDTALKTAILEEVGTRTTQNNQSLKQEIMGEVDGKLPNTAVLKESILGEVDTKITTNNQTFKSTVMSEVDSKIPDEATIKQNILAEVNPKLIDKDTFKQEILSALPSKDEYSLELTEDMLVLTKTNDPSYRKEINLSKYHDEVGQPINVESLKTDILSQVDTKISAIPKHNMTADEILNVLDNENDPEKFNNLANAIMIQFTSTDNHLRFHKTDSAYEIVLDPDGDGELLELSTPILTIPFTSLRELPTATQSEPVTIEKILALLKDESKASVVGEIAETLGITRPTPGSALIITPTVENGIFKPNPTTEVDFTNDFYTKSKVDALLSNAAPSGPIEGHGRPDKKAELNDAKIGTTYVDLDRTDGAYIWMKKSKWVVIEGDTGEVDFDQSIFTHCKIRRVNDTVIVTPNKSNNSTFKRDVIEELFDHNNSTKLSHYSKNGWEPLTETVIPFIWIYDSSQQVGDINWDIIPDQENKYVSYTGRVIFYKGIDEGMDIKMEPDYGLFGKDSENWILAMGLNDNIIMIYQQFIYQTDAVWPELSN